MGKKTNTTSNESAAAEKKEPTDAKQKRATVKPAAKKKSTLTEKAVKAVTAVALGVGGALAAKQKNRTSRKKAVEPLDRAPSNSSTPSPANYTEEDIALRAYFISESRRAAGLPGDPHQDWLEAEKELAQERRHQTA